MSICSEYGYTYELSCSNGDWKIKLNSATGIGGLGLTLVSCDPLLLTGVFAFCNFTVTE
jgi:hypothetical protein